MESNWVQMTRAQEHIELEYRVAVLEGIVKWLLSNAVLSKALESDELSEIYSKAAETVRRRHPQAEIDIKYEDLPRSGYGVVSE
jgi:hypothetical protein